MTDSFRYMPLARLVELRQQLEDDAFFTEGELTPEMERRWDAIAGSAREKIYNTGLAHCDDMLDVAAIDAEIARLTERKRIRENRIERRKAFLAPVMARLDIRNVEGPLCTVRLHKNSTLTITAGVNPGPQRDLFARGHDHRRGQRGHHVRIS